jgi:hypothetical protein
MRHNELRSTGFIFRIAGNVVLAGSLLTYLLTIDSAGSVVPAWVPVAGAGLGVCLLLVAVFVRNVPPGEDDIRREFEIDEARRIKPGESPNGNQRD